MALTRPIRSPSQPKRRPPAAAPTRKTAMTMDIQVPILCVAAPPISSCRAGRATRGKSPISSPSNIHPKNAARSAIHLPVVLVMSMDGLGVELTDASWSRSITPLVLGSGVVRVGSGHDNPESWLYSFLQPLCLFEDANEGAQLEDRGAEPALNPPRTNSYPPGHRIN